jgi:hypothetical protein
LAPATLRPLFLVQLFSMQKKLPTGACALKKYVMGARGYWKEVCTAPQSTANLRKIVVAFDAVPTMDDARIAALFRRANIYRGMTFDCFTQLAKHVQ